MVQVTLAILRLRGSVKATLLFLTALLFINNINICNTLHLAILQIPTLRD